MGEFKGNTRGGQGRPRASYSLLSTNPFLNPYNFVPTTEPNQCIDAETEGGTHTGYLTCRLVTRTPLAIPDVENKERRETYGKEHDYYPFMSVGATRIIPGSSIRGVIRNIYESTTNSCMVTVAGDDVITARTGATESFKPGILRRENNGWGLYEADRIAMVVNDGVHKRFYNPGKDIRSFDNSHKSGDNILTINGTDYAWGEHVWITMGDAYTKESNYGKSREIWPATVKNISKQQKDEYVDGYLYVGEQFTARKHAESVFIQKERLCDIDAAHIAKLEKTWDVYNDTAVNRNAERNGWYRGYETAKRNGVIPLWYNNKDQERLYLSFASIGRRAYDNALSDICNVGHTCTNRNHLCKACALFGMVGDQSMGSKVRFTDAHGISNVESMGDVLLKELGSPKPSYLPFYTKDGCDYDATGIEVRGRKYYWHNPAAATKSAVYTGRDASRSAEVELVGPGAEFEFKVYYDAITDEQLAELVWAMTLGENDDRAEHPHLIKIGHGKPLGLGSAKVFITGGIERNVDATEGVYTVNAINDVTLADYIKQGQRTAQSARGYNELMLITDYDATKGYEVRYPYISNPGDATSPNDAASHRWFTENRGTTRNAQPGLLPNIGDAVQRPLHPYQLGYTSDAGRRSGGGNGGRPGGNGNRSGGYPSNGGNRSGGGNSSNGGNWSRSGGSGGSTYRPIKPKSKPGK